MSINLKKYCTDASDTTGTDCPEEVKNVSTKACLSCDSISSMEKNIKDCYFDYEEKDSNGEQKEFGEGIRKMDDFMMEMRKRSFDYEIAMGCSESEYGNTRKKKERKNKEGNDIENGLVSFFNKASVFWKKTFRNSSISIIGQTGSEEGKGSREDKLSSKVSKSKRIPHTNL